MHFLLIGLFSAGKTTVGRSVAQKLELPFYDSDEWFEKSVGMSPRAYHLTKSDAAFRLKEGACVREILDQPHGVFACGGGTPLCPISKMFLKKCPQILYLNYSLSYIKENFYSRGLPHFVTSLDEEYAKRHPIYLSLATDVIECDHLELEAIEGIAVDAYENSWYTRAK